MLVSDSGTLKVYMGSGPSEEGLMFNSTSSRRSWTRFSQSIERSKPFQVTQNGLSGRNNTTNNYNMRNNGYFSSNLY